MNKIDNYEHAMQILSSSGKDRKNIKYTEVQIVIILVLCVKILGG